MDFFQLYLEALLVIMIMMTLAWLISVFIKNASIVDLIWGLGFVLANIVYFLGTEGFGIKKIILMIMVGLWGLRLSGYLTWRNLGKGEDFRYRQFRQNYGPERYWWVSFFQVFLLQGVLMWLISATLLGAQYNNSGAGLNWLDFAGILIWVIGFTFETGGDLQLARFKAKPENKGKLLNKGFWRYTRHPNYFGDAAVWWGYGLLCLASGSYVPVLGSVLMTVLLLKVSGVAMLERSLKESKPEYKEYIAKTSSFFPWLPRK